MKFPILLVSATFGLLITAGAATAQETSPAPAAQPALTVNIGAVSEYRFRGVSQTMNDPAVQGGADLTWGMAYAGTWASNVDFGGPKHAEVDLYGGIRPTVAGFNLDIGAIAYLYPGQASGAHEDYVEAKFAASRPIGNATLGGAVYWSPEFFGKTGDAVYYEVNVAYKVNDRWSASGALGRQDVSYAGDYTTWNAGVTFQATPKIALDLRYIDTDGHSFGTIYGSTAVASIKATF